MNVDTRQKPVITGWTFNLSSYTQDSALVETQQQANIKQRLVNVYVSFYPSFAMTTEWIWVMLVSVLKTFSPANKSRVWF